MQSLFHPVLELLANGGHALNLSGECRQSLQLIAHRIQNYDEMTIENGRIHFVKDRELLVTKSEIIASPYRLTIRSS